MKKGSIGPSEECGLHKWLGLYCEKYGRFYCAGKDKCSTPERYLEHFAAHRESLFRGSEEE